MKQKEKIHIVKDLVEKFSTFDSFYIIDAMGLTVAQVNKFRQNCLANNLLYQVAKNTLIQKALEKAARKGVEEVFFSKVLKGFSGILFASQAAKMPAKIVIDFLKSENLSVPVLKGAVVDEDVFVGAEHLKMLSQLKSKEEVLGDIVQCLQSPIWRLMASVQSVEKKLAGVVDKLSSSCSRGD